MPDGIWEEILKDLPLYIGATSAFFGGLVFGYKKIIKPLVNLKTEYNDTISKVRLIADEMVPNGGSSIKDIVCRIEKEVNLSSERYKAFMADNESAIFETDSEGKCLWVNRTYSKTVQRMPSELMGHGWVNAISRKDRERVVTGWNEAVIEDREFVDEFSFQTPDGTLIPTRVISYKMTDRNKGTIGYLGVCRIDG